MTTQTATADTLLARYADDIAFVAEETPATTLSAFAEQLETAAEYLDGARIQGVDLKLAAIYLQDGDLGRAAEYLADIPDLVDEYRLMV